MRSTCLFLKNRNTAVPPLILGVPCLTQVANERSSPLDLLLIQRRSKTASPINNNLEPVSQRKENSIPSNMTATKGADEGIEAWIRHTDVSSTPSSRVHSPGSEVILAVNCSLPGVNGAGAGSFCCLRAVWSPRLSPEQSTGQSCRK